jgi:hypothetical protein
VNGKQLFPSRHSTPLPPHHGEQTNTSNCSAKTFLAWFQETVSAVTDLQSQAGGYQKGIRQFAVSAVSEAESPWQT